MAELQPALERIVQLIKAGQGQQAEAQAREILRSSPQEPNTVFLLAKAAEEKRRQPEAGNHC